MKLSLVAVVTFSLGCGVTSDRNTDGAPAAAAAAAPGQFSGRVTNADGSRITLPGVRFSIAINGITAVGENNRFPVSVGADGTFSLKLPRGMFYPPYGTITFPFEGKNYVADLDPVNPGEGTRNSAGGIVQNFVWRITGPKPRALNPDINNATHWFGITVPLLFQPYRSDNQQVMRPLPDGSSIVWTLRPTSKLIDGSEAKLLSIKRRWSEMASPSMDALNDLPPTNYEVSGVATLPDGSTKLLLLQDMDDRKYKPTSRLVLAPYANGGTVYTLPAMIMWVVP